MRKKSVKKTEKVDTVEKLAVLMVEEFRRVDARFDRIDERFDRLEGRMEKVEMRLGEVENTLDYIRAEIAHIHRSIEHLEERGARTAGFSKEIDYLLERVARIEEHVGLKK